MADLEHVISNAVEDAGDVGIEEPSTDAPAEGDAPPAPAPPPEESDPFAKEHGLITRRPDGRENRIPYSKVKTISENTLQKAKAEWEASIRQEREELAQLRAYRQATSPFESVVDVDGDRMIQALAARNPQLYGKFAALLQQAQQAPATQTQSPASPMPAPDLDLGGGSMTYSGEQYQKLLEWQMGETIRKAEEKIAKRLQPIEEERAAAHKAAQERQQRQVYESQVTQHVDRTLERMRKLPGFTENEEAILAAFKADKDATVHDAYLTVMLPKFQQGKTQVRSQVLREIQEAPTKTSAGTNGAVDETDRPQSIEDIIRASVAGLK